MIFGTITVILLVIIAYKLFDIAYAIRCSTMDQLKTLKETEGFIMKLNDRDLFVRLEELDKKISNLDQDDADYEFNYYQLKDLRSALYTDDTRARL